MAAVDLDLPISRENILSEFTRPIIAVVQTQNWPELDRGLARILAGIEGRLDEWHSRQWLRAQLMDVVMKIPEQEIREEFLRPDISERELIGALEYAGSESLLTFTENVLRLSKKQPQLSEFLRDKFDNVLYFAGTEEKERIISFIRSEKLPDGEDLTAAVIESSESLEEMESLVAAAGDESIQGSALFEHAALAKVIRFCRALEIPDALGGQADFEDCERQLSQLRESVELLRRFCEDNRDLASCQAYQDLLATAESDLADLDKIDLSADDRAATIDELNVCRALLELELRYGVNISYGTDDFLSLLHADSLLQPKPWTMQDADDIGAVLESIPEKFLLFSSRLREIQKVAYLGDGVLGARFRDGTIKIAELTFNHEGMQKAYRGESSLRIVLAHEIGHGLQIGGGLSGIDYDSAYAPSFQGGEARFDFDEYLTLSGWRVIEPERFEIMEDGIHVILDGRLYETGSEIDHNGERMVLVLHPEEGLLLSYDAKATFSYRSYSRTSPWEDFAEAFAEYLFLPDRLIELSPEKFQFIEQEFRRYHGDECIQDLLRRAMKRETKADGDNTILVRAGRPKILFVQGAGSAPGASIEA